MADPARPPVPTVAWLLVGMVVLLSAGSLRHDPRLLAVAGGCAVLASVLQWRQLLVMARVFLILAVAGGLGLLALWPETGPALAGAVTQGAGFAALMAVLGLLRHPVRRSSMVARAAQTLLAAPPRRRFAATYAGSHLMAVLFNVGIIAMIADMTQGAKARPAMVLAAMRGAATVAIWSPVGLGFAIVSTSLPTFQPLTFLAVATSFSAIALAVTSIWPALPRLQAGEATTAHQSGAALAGVAAICVALLGLVILLHRGAGIGFTIASVIVLPLVALIWIALLRGPHRALGHDIAEAVGGLSSLRNESTIFLSANVVGVILSILLGRTGFPELLASGVVPMLPLLLACLVIVPLTAAACIPNSVFVVMLAQLLGPSPLGLEHPVALGLTLTVSWATAIVVSPISAMCLMTAAACGVPSHVVGHRWNAPFAVLLTLMGAVAVTLLMLWPG